MAIDLIFSPDRVNNPFEASRRALIKALAEMPVPAPYGSYPEPEDHEAVRDHIRRASDIFDAWLRGIGEEVRCNSTSPIDLTVFTGQYAMAVDGWSTYELDTAAAELREDMAEARAS